MQCYPERKTFLDCIDETKELDGFIKSAANNLKSYNYRLHGKGRDKYSHFYYHWLQYQTAVVADALTTCRHDDITDENKRVVLIGVLNEVHNHFQQRISAEIEAISNPRSDTSAHPTGSDDVALYRLGGWALFSDIQKRKSRLKSPSRCKVGTKQELDVLHLFTIPKADKAQLPAALRYLDRGRLTFPRPCLLPFMRAVEQKMLELLNESIYARYGRRIFEVSKL